MKNRSFGARTLGLAQTRQGEPEIRLDQRAEQRLSVAIICQISPRYVLACAAMGERTRLNWALGAALCLAASATGEEVPRSLRWELVEVARPRFLWADGETVVRVVVRNAGTEPWSSAEKGDYLSYRWLAADGTVVESDGVRSEYPRSVAPGEDIEVQARIGPPPAAGVWRVELQPLREGVCWLGPPQNGPAAQLWVRAVSRTAVYQTAFSLLTLVLIVGGLRLRRHPRGAWWFLLVVPVVWCVVGVLIQGFAFLLRSGYGWQPESLGLEVAAAALLALPVALVPVRVRPWAAALCVVFAAFTAFADVLYFQYFGSLVPLAALQAIGQTGRVMSSVQALTRSADAWFSIGAATALAFALFLRVGRTVPPAARLTRWRAVSAVALTTGLSAWPALATARETFSSGGLAAQVFSHDQMVRQWGIGVTHLVDVVRTAREQVASRQPDETVRQQVFAFFRSRQIARLPPSPCSGAARGMNLVLIQVESLQQWVVGTRIDGQEVTPFLNALRAEALYFPFLFDQSDQGRTSDGEFIALNSLHALDRGAVAFRRAANAFHALPAVLGQAGYTTLSAHAFERGFWNRAVLHPRYGFETSLFREELGVGEVIGWGLADHVFFERMVPRLAAQRQPFMAFLITLGQHYPFDSFPVHHRVLRLADLENTPLGNYLHAMHYVDSALARLIADLREVGLAQRTVIALYGDHDSGLDPMGRMLDVAGWPPRDASTWPRIDRVPLFVLLPGRDHSCRGEMKIEGGHLDIAPTLLDLLGLRPPPAFLGTSLLRPRTTPVAGPYGTAALGGVIGAEGGHGLVEEMGCWEIEGGRELAFDLCRPLQEQARVERAVSHWVVLYDLIEEINGKFAS